MNNRAVFLLAIALFLAACGEKHTGYVEPATRMQFVLVPAGEFMMGSRAGEPGHRDDEVLHRVKISKPFYIGATEVTQQQWIAVMATNPSHFRDSGLDVPVESITWYDAQEFVRRLNRLGHGRFRLPTEAEWEYACRAGTRTPYAFGGMLSTADANYDGRYPMPGQPPGTYRAAPVRAAALRANAWGIRNMHGNVWEWCEDDYCPYPSTASTDPVGRCDSGRKVIRGGSWYFNAESARSALRYTHRPQDRGFSIGLRIVREADAR